MCSHVILYNRDQWQCTSVQSVLVRSRVSGTPDRGRINGDVCWVDYVCWFDVIPLIYSDKLQVKTATWNALKFLVYPSDLAYTYSPIA